VRFFSSKSTSDPLQERSKSTLPNQESGESLQQPSDFSSVYKMELEAHGVILKMGNALALIEAQGHKSADDEARIMRLQKDLKDLYVQFQNLVFWEEQDGAKGVADLTDEEWTTQEKVRELKMKKLVTVAKSKFYMLKVNYSAIVEQVSNETGSPPVEETEEAPAAKLNINFGA